MLYGDSFVYMSILSDRGYGKIYNGKVNALLHFYTTRAAQTFDCAAQVGAELRYNIKIISIHRYYLPDLYIIQFLRKNFKMIPNYIMGLLLCTNAMTKNC